MNPTQNSLVAAFMIPAAAWAQATAPANQTAPTAPPAAATTPVPMPPAPYQAKAVVDFMDLKDGDSIVFLGDSITHQCLYTQYVEDYFYTRFPKKRLHFHNAGVGGDRASDALTRFDEDVARYKPKYVTVLLGMNDGTYTRYDQAIFDTYQRDMNTVLDRIAGVGATAIPMTPTMFDSRSKRLFAKRETVNETRETYYSGVLALYGAWLREQAFARGLGFVDMNSPLNSLTFKQRAKDPTWTTMRDGVHPQQTGQVIMACAILSDMVAKTPVSQVTVAERGGKRSVFAANAKATDFKAEGDTISFTLEAASLPWVLPEDAQEGYKLTAAGHRYSNEKLTVHSLKPGRYELKIDGSSVGEWAAEQLAAGIELESNAKTPQYQQALQVALLNKKRVDEAYHPIRNEYAQLKGQRRSLKQLAAAGDANLAVKQAEFETWYDGQKKRVADLLTKARAIEDEIYQANQPKPHRYELAPVPTAKAAIPSVQK